MFRGLWRTTLTLTLATLIAGGALIASQTAARASATTTAFAWAKACVNSAAFTTVYAKHLEHFMAATANIDYALPQIFIKSPGAETVSFLSPGLANYPASGVYLGLGHANQVTKYTAYDVPGLQNVVAMAAAAYSAYALRPDGKVVSWGANSRGSSATRRSRKWK